MGRLKGAPRALFGPAPARPTSARELTPVTLAIVAAHFGAGHKGARKPCRVRKDGGGVGVGGGSHRDARYPWLSRAVSVAGALGQYENRRRLSARHPGFPKPGPPRPQPPVVYDPQKPLRSVSGGEALGHGRWARPARAQAAADRLCVRRPGTPSH
ncbi:unnamed protein product [Rangifer tarandus platyrhynchus]|uniref:Uncharacterized protein n=1 Tax=Rangifer tarandus platyrhynchus TaxID=3082113 RepID=A0AC59YGM4_RANTA